MTLQNKNVLITGSNRGLGKALVTAFLNEGSNVIEMTRKDCDLSNVDEVQSYAKNLGRVDVLVNCAGVFPVGTIHDTTLEQYQECIAVNLTAPFVLSQQLSKGMCDRGWGRIINIASSSAYGGGTKTSVYCASKHGLLGMSRAFHSELKTQGVRVICVSPGTIKTDMGREVENLGQIYDTFMEPDEIAEYVVYNAGLDGHMINEEIRLNRLFVQ